MADGRPTPSRPLLWTVIFRSFQIALDPRKLLVAAAGILLMSLLWWLLSVIFYYKAPSRSADEYSEAVVRKSFEGRLNPKTGKPYTNDELVEAVRAETEARYQTDLEQWKVLDSLAGPGGRLRTLPWSEYRGPNPFLLVTDLISGTATERMSAVSGFVYGSIPVLVEPLVKLFIPVTKLIAPGVSPLTRLYLLLVLLSNIAVWAFAGGIITRIAAVQLANKDPISIVQAYRFVRDRYLSYLATPLLPLIIIFACVVGLILYGVLGLIPFVGDVVVLGVGLPLVIAGGFVMAVFLVGLVGYPLMYPTLSTEGDHSDTFDALSRSISYVYQAPWHYIWYWLVAVAYGAAVTFFVLFFTSLAVYVGKWAVSLTAATVWTERQPDFLFIYAPESFEWRMLLTKDSPYEIRPAGGTGWVWIKADGTPTANPAEGVRQVYRYEYKDPLAAEQAHADTSWYRNYYMAAAVVAFWLAVFFLLMLGFSYSFFWTAATVVFLLMRKQVDDAEFDEVFLEGDDLGLNDPLPPFEPGESESQSGPTPAGSSLPVINLPQSSPTSEPPSPAATPPSYSSVASTVTEPTPSSVAGTPATPPEPPPSAPVASPPPPPPPESAAVSPESPAPAPETPVTSVPSPYTAPSFTPSASEPPPAWPPPPAVPEPSPTISEVPGTTAAEVPPPPPVAPEPLPFLPPPPAAPGSGPVLDWPLPPPLPPVPPSSASVPPEAGGAPTVPADPSQKPDDVPPPPG